MTNRALATAAIRDIGNDSSIPWDASAENMEGAKEMMDFYFNEENKKGDYMHALTLNGPCHSVDTATVVVGVLNTFDPSVRIGLVVSTQKEAIWARAMISLCAHHPKCPRPADLSLPEVLVNDTKDVFQRTPQFIFFVNTPNVEAVKFVGRVIKNRMDACHRL